MEYPYALNVVQEAFAILGQSSLPQVVDDEQENPTFRDCSRIYNQIRKAVLTAHPWNFATVRTGIAAAAIGAGNQYVCALPGDCLQLLRLENRRGEELERARYGNTVYTEGEAVTIVYLRDEEDPEVWDPWARKALVHRLAADFSRIVKGSLQERQLQEEAYTIALLEAKRVNSQEGFTTVSKSYADKLIRGEA